MEIHRRTMGCHLPYGWQVTPLNGITPATCHPDTSEHTLP